MDAETVRVILERTFRMPVNESDARIVLGRLNEIYAKEDAEQSAQADVAKCLPDEHKFVNNLHCSVCGESQFSRVSKA